MANARPERLDQILIRLGFATEAQVAQALQKQQGLGGRLGTHLVYAGHVTEEQLAQALSAQFGVPAWVAGRAPSRDLLERLPAGFARHHLVLPLGLDEDSGTLELAAVDPRDTAAVGEARRLLRCREVALCVIPEVTLERVLAAAGLDDGGVAAPRRLIELPELFAGREEPGLADTGRAPAKPSVPRILLVSGRPSLGSFLAPLFEREGRALSVAADPAQAAALLGAGDIDHVLVAADAESAWRAWRSPGQPASPQPQVTRLGAVSDTLLDAAAPYDAMRQAVLGALRLLAEQSAEASAQPPAFDLVRRDARELGEALGLERLAVDAIEAAVLMLAPAAPPAASVDALLADDGTGIDWPRTLATAAAVGFPWRVEAALAAMRQALGGRVNLAEAGRGDGELSLAAQALALAWLHHQMGGPVAGSGGAHTANRNAALRARGGQVAAPEVVERYLEILARNEDDLVAAGGGQVLLVGGDEPAMRRLGTRLAHLGYRLLVVRTLDEAAELCARQAPAAVIVHDGSFPQEMPRVRARLAGAQRLPVCAATTAAEPARLLNLFDAGFDDVFALPRDLDLVAARLRKALQAASRAAAGAPAIPARPGSFQAAFTAFAFTDLMQTLSQSLKSVRIDLERPGGEQAVVHLDRGQLVHAACGSLRGAEAVYRVIAWEDDGAFAVEPTTEFPEPNIGLPLESILMEGCRLLDESRL